MKLVVDLETNGLFDYKNKTGPTVIHCATTIDVDTEEIHEFSGEFSGLLELLDKADVIIGHNFIQYDRQVLKTLLNYEIPLMKIHDTLVLSRLLDPKGRSHSIDAWAKTFDMEKPAHDDWSTFSPEMQHRCTEDTKINLKVYNKLWNQFESHEFSKASFQVECVMAELARQQTENGSPVNIELVTQYYYECKDQADQLELKISKAFPPVPDTRKTAVKHFVPRYTKDGKLHKTSANTLARYGFNEDDIQRYWGTPPPEADEETGKLPQTIPEIDNKSSNYGSVTLFHWRSFDVDALSFVKDHLLRLGWHPLEYAAAGSPKITEESLDTLDIPEAHLLKDYIILRNRERVFKRWMEETSDEGYIHSPMNPMGTWTHRCSHTNFMGNPPRLNTDSDGNSLKKLPGGYGYECREVWEAPDGFVLVGADASGIQMRGFAHYIEDDAYVKQVVESDIHEFNRQLAGLKSRNSAKTFIYMYLLGGGNHKAGVVYDMTKDELEEMKDLIMNDEHTSMREMMNYGLEYLKIPANPVNYAIAYRGFLTKQRFEQAIPGLQKFKEQAKQEARRGTIWLRALDGRLIRVHSAHKKLAAALQSFEACVMKRATITYQKSLTKRDIWFKQCNMVHDEWLVMTKEDLADEVGKTMVQSIRETGALYGSKCPLDGEYRVGRNWLEVH